MRKEEIARLFPIHTERLTLRLATMEDADLIQAAKESRSDNSLRRWMSWSSEEGMSVQGTINYLQHFSTSNRCVAILAVDKETGAHVLSTGLDAEDDDLHVATTGWWLSAGHEGRGLAYEGVSALIDFCRAHQVCQKLRADYYEGNQRSQKLMERLGFQHIRTDAKAHKCHLNGEMMDVHRFELIL